MSAAINPATDRRQQRAGVVLTGLVALFLAFDSVIHILNTSQVKTTMADLGWPDHLAPAIGAIELIALALYLLPRTSLLGAVLLTGYLGGAVATNLRAEVSLFGNTLFPVYVGIVVWGALYLRDRLLRSIVDTMRRGGDSPN